MPPNDERWAHKWTPWIPFHLTECPECSALVMDQSESKANHEAWHEKADR